MAKKATILESQLKAVVDSAIDRYLSKATEERYSTFRVDVVKGTYNGETSLEIGYYDSGVWTTLAELSVVNPASVTDIIDSLDI